MAAPDDRWPVSRHWLRQRRRPRAALLHVGSCVLGRRPPDLALPGETLRRDPL